MTFLIVRLGALGDIVHALPLAAGLRTSVPGARIDWLVDVRHRPVLDFVPILDRVHTIDTRRLAGGSGVLNVLRALRNPGYDVAFDAQGLLKSAALARASGARRVVGFARTALREPAAAMAYTHAIDPTPAVHVVDRTLTLLRAVGIDRAPRNFPITVPQSDAVPRVRRMLGLGPADPFVLINCGAAWPNKRWPPERFGALAGELARRAGLRSAVLWGPGEEVLARRAASSSSGAAEAASPTSLADVVALVHAARLVVSGDTGPIHLAAAVGTPIVGIYGPTDPARNGPWSPQDVTVSRRAQCGCFHLRRCRERRWCLGEVTVDEVFEAVTRRLATPAAGADLGPAPSA